MASCCETGPMTACSAVTPLLTALLPDPLPIYSGEKGKAYLDSDLSCKPAGGFILGEFNSIKILCLAHDIEYQAEYAGFGESDAFINESTGNIAFN